MRLRLIQRREVRRLTWTGRLAVALTILVLLRALAPALFRGLAVSRPLADAEYTLIEGWIADADLAALLAHPSVGDRSLLLATGGPIERGGVLLPEYPDYARFAQARLAALGAAPERLAAAPAGATVRDRTYTAAQAARAFFAERGITRARVNLATRGVHARRSALLFRRALGPEFELGTIALPEEFGAADWWKSSNGFRSVLYEWIAWGYTKVFLAFAPDSAP